MDRFIDDWCGTVCLDADSRGRVYARELVACRGILAQYDKCRRYRVVIFPGINSALSIRMAPCRL